MEEIKWNFPDTNHLLVKMMETDRSLLISGEVTSDSRYFVASTNSLRKSCLTKDEQAAIMARLSFLTMNDHLTIIWDE